MQPTLFETTNISNGASNQESSNRHPISLEGVTLPALTSTLSPEIFKMEIFKNEDAVSFLGSLSDNTIDLLLTDPPYNISKKTGFKSSGPKGVERLKVSMDFGEWDKGIDENATEQMLTVFKVAYKKMRTGATLVCFYDLWKIQELSKSLTEAGFKMFRFIEWVKKNPVPLNSKRLYLTNAREVAVVAVKGSKPVFNAEYHNGIFSYPIHRDGGKRLHPTQKPILLMRELIRIHSREGDLVVDPFAGSATTLVSAKMEKRAFAGCEIDKTYFDLASKRLVSLGK